MVMSGIEVQNYDQAVSIIKEQMAAMKNGDFTEQEFEQTKAVIRNQLLETVDTAYGLVEIVYHNVIANINRSFEDYLNGIEKVTKEEVTIVAQKIELDTIYFLKGMGERHDNKSYSLRSITRIIILRKMSNGLDVYVLPKKVLTKLMPLLRQNTDQLIIDLNH